MREKGEENRSQRFEELKLNWKTALGPKKDTLPKCAKGAYGGGKAIERTSPANWIVRHWRKWQVIGKKAAEWKDEVLRSGPRNTCIKKNAHTYMVNAQRKKIHDVLKANAYFKAQHWQIGTYVCFLFSKMSFFSVLSVGIYTDGNSWPTKDFTVKTKPNAKMKTATDSGNWIALLASVCVCVC